MGANNVSRHRPYIVTYTARPERSYRTISGELRIVGTSRQSVLATCRERWPEMQVKAIEPEGGKRA